MRGAKRGARNNSKLHPSRNRSKSRRNISKTQKGQKAESRGPSGTQMHNLPGNLGGVTEAVGTESEKQEYFRKLKLLMEIRVQKVRALEELSKYEGQEEVPVQLKEEQFINGFDQSRRLRLSALGGGNNKKKRNKSLRDVTPKRVANNKDHVKTASKRRIGKENSLNHSKKVPRNGSRNLAQKQKSSRKRQEQARGDRDRDRERPNHTKKSHQHQPNYLNQDQKENLENITNTVINKAHQHLQASHRSRAHASTNNTPQGHSGHQLPPKNLQRGYNRHQEYDQHEIEFQEQEEGVNLGGAPQQSETDQPTSSRTLNRNNRQQDQPSAPHSYLYQEDTFYQSQQEPSHTDSSSYINSNNQPGKAPQHRHQYSTDSYTSHGMPNNQIQQSFSSETTPGSYPNNSNNQMNGNLNGRGGNSHVFHNHQGGPQQQHQSSINSSRSQTTNQHGSSQEMSQQYHLASISSHNHSSNRRMHDSAAVKRRIMAQETPTHSHGGNYPPHPPQTPQIHSSGMHLRNHSHPINYPNPPENMHSNKPMHLPGSHMTPKQPQIGAVYYPPHGQYTPQQGALGAYDGYSNPAMMAAAANNAYLQSNISGGLLGQQSTHQNLHDTQFYQGGVYNPRLGASHHHHQASVLNHSNTGAAVGIPLNGLVPVVQGINMAHSLAYPPAGANQPGSFNHLSQQSNIKRKQNNGGRKKRGNRKVKKSEKKRRKRKKRQKSRRKRRKYREGSSLDSEEDDYSDYDDLKSSGTGGYSRSRVSGGSTYSRGNDDSEYYRSSRSESGSSSVDSRRSKHRRRKRRKNQKNLKKNRRDRKRDQIYKKTLERIDMVNQINYQNHQQGLSQSRFEGGSISARNYLGAGNGHLRRSRRNIGGFDQGSDQGGRFLVPFNNTVDGVDCRRSEAIGGVNGGRGMNATQISNSKSYIEKFKRNLEEIHKSINDPVPSTSEDLRSSQQLTTLRGQSTNESLYLQKRRDDRKRQLASRTPDKVGDQEIAISNYASRKQHMRRFNRAGGSTRNTPGKLSSSRNRPHQSVKNSAGRGRNEPYYADRAYCDERGVPRDDSHERNCSYERDFEQSQQKSQRLRDEPNSPHRAENGHSEAQALPPDQTSQGPNQPVIKKAIKMEFNFSKESNNSKPKRKRGKKKTKSGEEKQQQPTSGVKQAEAFEINFDEEGNGAQAQSLAEAFRNKKKAMADRLEQKKVSKTKQQKEINKFELFQKRKEMMMKKSVEAVSRASKAGSRKDKSRSRRPASRTPPRSIAGSKSPIKMPPNAVMERLTKGEKSKLSRKEMIELNQRRYKLLPEVKKKRQERRRKEDFLRRQANLKKFNLSVRNTMKHKNTSSNNNRRGRGDGDSGYHHHSHVSKKAQL